jgi:hypothetical protein
MGFKENQEGKYVQKTEGSLRKVTGLFKRRTFNKKGESVVYYKSPRINIQGWINMNAFGSDTVLMIMPNPRKKVNAPDAILFAVHHDGKDER